MDKGKRTSTPAAISARRVTDLGFTLIEVMVAVLIASMVMVAVSASFLGTMNAHYEIDNANSVMSEGQRVLDIMERDLRSLWHYDIKKIRVLYGRSRDIGGYDADRLDILASTDAIEGVVDLENRIGHPGVCEVGYWLKENREIPGLLVLCRREDPLVDDDMTLGGKFQRVSERVKSLNITYYETLGYDAEPRDEWDSGQDGGKLPRRIKIELKLHRRIGNRNQVSGAEISDDFGILETYVRHIVFDQRYEKILQAGIAMVPVAPVAPSDQPTSAGGGDQGGSGGGGSGGGGARGGNGMPGVGEGGNFMVGNGRPPGGARGGQGGRTPGGPGGRGQPPSGGPPIDLGGLLRGGGNAPGGLNGLFGNGGRGGGNPFGGASR